MSYTNGMKFGELTNNVFGCRTVAEIQRKVIKQHRENPVSRLFHAKNNKETITNWKLDLNQTLHIFNVCSVSSILLSLTTSLSD